MRLTFVLYFSLKLVLSKNIDEKDILLVFEQQWPKLHFALISLLWNLRDCGNLYGGSRGACPKSLPISYPCPLPMNCSETESSVSHHLLSRFAYKLTYLLQTKHKYKAIQSVQTASCCTKYRKNLVVYDKTSVTSSKHNSLSLGHTAECRMSIHLLDILCNYCSFVMRLTFIIFATFKLVSSSKEDQLFDTIVFEQQWPVCKNTVDCPFSSKTNKSI